MTWQSDIEGSVEAILKERDDLKPMPLAEASRTVSTLLAEKHPGIEARFTMVVFDEEVRTGTLTLKTVEGPRNDPIRLEKDGGSWERILPVRRWSQFRSDHR